MLFHSCAKFGEVLCFDPAGAPNPYSVMMQFCPCDFISEHKVSGQYSKVKCLHKTVHDFSPVGCALV